MTSRVRAEQFSSELPARDLVYIRSLGDTVLHELVPWAADFCDFEITAETRNEATEENARRMGIHPGAVGNPWIINTAEYLRH